MSRAHIIVIVCLASFFCGAGYGATFLLPVLVESFGAGTELVGGVLAAAAVSTLLTVAYAGHVSDRIGRAPAVGLAGLLLAAANAAFALSGGHPGLLLAGGIVIGIGWGLFYCLSAIILAVLIEPESRARMFLVSHACLMGGIGSAPLLAPLARSMDAPLVAAFALVALGTALSGLALFAIAPAIRREESVRKVEGVARLSLRAARLVLASEARYPIIMVGLGACVFAGFHAYQTVIAEAAGVDYAYFFSIYAATVVLFRIVLAATSPKVPLYLASAWLLAAMTAGSALFLAIGGSLALYALAAILLGIGYGIAYALIKAIVANEAPEGLSPQAMQLFNLSYFVGVFAFPGLGGVIIAEYGAMAFVAVMAVLAAIECAIAIQRHARQRNAEAARPVRA
ncbi:MAG: MFS transporter [Alphaproteobacteria bacterium]